MPYDEYTVKRAKEKGIFEDNIFDPKVLQLSEEEKKKLQSDLEKATSGLEAKSQDYTLKDSSEDKEIEVKLSFFEKIWVFILSFFGILSLSEYKLRKSLHSIIKQLAKIKPPIFLPHSKKLTPFFALRIYNLYTMLGMIRKVINETLNAEEWANPNQLRKTGLELFFEKLCMVNPNIIDEKFSYQNIQKVINEFGNIKNAWEGIEEAIAKHFESFPPEAIETANLLYTNFIYLKRLAEYDFIALLRRFDPDFTMKTTPNFTEVSGEALLPYLVDLESIFIQIDFSLNNLDVLKKLIEVKKFINLVNEEEEIDDNIEEELIQLLTNLKNMAYEASFTNIIKILKKDPLYSASVLYTKFDLFKLYCEIFHKRIKYVTETSFKERKSKEIESYVNKIFKNIEWVGIYNNEFSEKLEARGFGSFEYIYQIATINTFLTDYFNTTIKSFLSLVLLSGFFLDKFFQKTLSELTYDLEKFEEKFNEFFSEMQKDGNTAKKVIGYLERRDITADIKKTIERLITNINTNAKELFNEFANIFFIIEDCIDKLRKDIDLHPPKYLRNIRSIGGSKNTKLLTTLIEDNEKLKDLKEVISFLRD
ncbi:MAG: DUF5312 family protein [Brevinematales bacterium]|nr:DUF5312 family protein [Brevinematales bacterium]